MARCENHASVRCKIFAQDQFIVWDGKVILENWDSQDTDENKTIRARSFADQSDTDYILVDCYTSEVMFSKTSAVGSKRSLFLVRKL